MRVSSVDVIDTLQLNIPRAVIKGSTNWMHMSHKDLCTANIYIPHTDLSCPIFSIAYSHLFQHDFEVLKAQVLQLEQLIAAKYFRRQWYQGYIYSLEWYKEHCSALVKPVFFTVKILRVSCTSQCYILTLVCSTAAVYVECVHAEEK